MSDSETISFVSAAMSRCGPSFFADWASDALEGDEVCAGGILATTSSPIEALMLVALDMALRTRGVLKYSISPTDTATDDADIAIFPQFKIGRYTADFSIIGKDGTKVVVECDGHAFHSATKEQVAHDKRRDRFFAASGFRVLRFSGSELHQDAMRCAMEVLDLLSGEAHDNYWGPQKIDVSRIIEHGRTRLRTRLAWPA